MSRSWLIWAKQLIAYAGLNPSVYSSQKFTTSSNRITKRGSKSLVDRCFLLYNADFARK
nr:transposase [Paenibacillus sp. SDF0028]